MSGIARGIARSFVNGSIVRLSRTRVTGETPEAAKTTAGHLLGRGYSVTLAYWNRDDDSPGTVVSNYERTLDVMKGMAPGSYLSLKAPSFAFDADLYHRVLIKARSSGVPLHFDSLGPEDADRTLDLIARHTPPPLADIGFTLPGRWRRSVKDADTVAGLGLPVRVVKGEWEDPADSKADPVTGFLAVIRQLAGKARHVRVATHNGDLAEQSIRILQQAGTPCDLELLYGFPVRHVFPRVRPFGVPIRLYVPYGHGWVPYCVKHVRTRPGFLWWLMKDQLAGRYEDGFPDRVTAA